MTYVSGVSVNVMTPCNMTCITLIYTAVHYVTLPNIAKMINKTCIVPDHVTLSNLA